MRSQEGLSLLIEGWRGVNHSYALVNQYQILELLQMPGMRLFHHDLPFFRDTWNRVDNNPDFLPEAQARIDALPPAGDAPIDCVYRIAAPIPGGSDTDRRRTLTFIATEFGLRDSNFAIPPDRFECLTRDANLIVTPTRWSRDRIVDFGFPSEGVRVVPHGADASLFRPLDPEERAVTRAALGITPDETLFVNVGGAFWNKGADLLVLAFAKLREQGHRARLILKDQRGLYGVTTEQIVRDAARDHPALLHAETLAAISVVPGNLTRPQLRALYGIADCYASPYRAEGFNLPVLEAIACGTPVIVTAGGATDDFCTDGVAVRIPGEPRCRDDMQAGLVVRYIEPDFDALMAAMEAFAARRGMDQAGFAAAREHVLQRFNWRHAAQELVRLAEGGADQAMDGRDQRMPAEATL